MIICLCSNKDFLAYYDAKSEGRAEREARLRAAANEDNGDGGKDLKPTPDTPA